MYSCPNYFFEVVLILFRKYDGILLASPLKRLIFVAVSPLNSTYYMKKILIYMVALSLVAFAGSCKKGQSGHADDVDSLALDSTSEDLLPMFLYYHNPDNMQIMFWTSLEKPYEPDSAWTLQVKTRKYEQEYTKLLVSDGRWVDVKFRDEQLKDPDGKDLMIWALHREEVPSCGIRYAFENISDTSYMKGEYGAQMLVLVTDDYLKTHKQLKVESFGWENRRKMDASVVEKLEEQYQMKAQRSVMTCKMEDGRYAYGVVQFKPQNKKVMALQVLTDGTEIYVSEEERTVDEDESSIWNVDDGGEYVPSNILAAFEGAKGLHLCYVRHAAESTETGWISVGKDKKLNIFPNASYYNYVDEPLPFYHVDMARLVKILRRHDSMFENVKMTKWAYWDIDNDAEEEVWIESEDGYGAVFSLVDEEPKLIVAYDTRMTPKKYMSGAIMLKGSCGSGCERVEIVKMEKSRKKHVLTEVHYYQDEEREEAQYEMDGKSVSKETAEQWKEKVLVKENTYGPYFRSFGD